MANPLFNMLNKNNNQNNIFSAFQNFMQQMQGKNPSDILNEVVQKKGITQEQLNQVQQRANQIMPQFEKFKNMFGFKD